MWCKFLLSPLFGETTKKKFQLQQIFEKTFCIFLIGLQFLSIVKMRWATWRFVKFSWYGVWVFFLGKFWYNFLFVLGYKLFIVNFLQYGMFCKLFFLFFERQLYLIFSFFCFLHKTYLSDSFFVFVIKNLALVFCLLL